MMWVLKKLSMNNNIQESYCKFEISKLLKEKGFDVQLSSFYNEHKELTINKIGITRKINNSRTHLGADTIDDFKPYLAILDNSLDDIVLAPTHSLAIKWIRENFNIHITIVPNEPFIDNDWVFILYENLKEFTAIEGYDSVEEAESAAILYTLKNLIK